MNHSLEAANAAANHDVIAFVQGQQDCKYGEPHADGKGESYDAGYSFQYQLQEVLAANGQQRFI